MDYADLERLIDVLESRVEESNPQRGYWAELWKLVRDVGDGFKGARYPTNGEREAAWRRFQSLIQHAKTRSEKQRNLQEDRRREWENRQRRSESARDAVQGRAAGARLTTPGESAFADAVLFPLTMIRTIVEALLHIENVDQLHEIRRELAACNERLQQGWQIFNQNKGDMLPGDRNEAFNSLQEAREQIDSAWAQWKGAKEQFYERRHHERLERKEERERKHRDFVDRVETNIAKLEEKLSRAEDALERQEAHLADLRDKQDSAWSESFRDRCSEWIDEAEERIESIKESIARLNRWLEEERDNIR
jgi:predicted  nucleic acid-binding Zn-ribbon protein